jgi:hypothetical protein
MRAILKHGLWILAACAPCGLVLAACNSLTGLDQDYVEVDCLDNCHPGSTNDGGIIIPSIDGSHDAAQATCTMIPTTPADAGAGGTCGPTSGACVPGNVSAYLPSFKPPTGAYQGRCTQAQISSYYNECFASTSTTQTCQTWTMANADCNACLENKETDPAWAAIVDLDNNSVQVNVPGCIALLEPCNVQCAEAYQAWLRCEQAACESNCPVGTDTQSFTNYANCTCAADQGGCSRWVTQCFKGLAGPLHPASICVTPTDFQTYFMNIAPLFCGSPP